MNLKYVSLLKMVAIEFHLTFWNVLFLGDDHDSSALEGNLALT